ncbi:MAG: hypothetical protein PHP08_00855 [Candidatus Dojkabacteria bacterium]|nr:hypothetical protein [Candidatus Dojkabacteria bacterium]
MIKGTICCNCNKREATKYWHGGQVLCNECFKEWIEKDKKFREDFRKEIMKKDSIVKGTENMKNWFE